MKLLLYLGWGVAIISSAYVSPTGPTLPKRSHGRNRYIIFPGLGGSVLYNPHNRNQQIWPMPLGDISTNVKNLGINPSSSPPSVYDTIRSIGDVSNIRIDTGIMYLLTKNVYYSVTIDKLQKLDHHVHAFPYDFRYIHYPEYYTELFNEYKAFIENKWSVHKEKSVIIAHSTGGLVCQRFLNGFVTPDWIEKYISDIYYVSVPFGGCPEGLFFLVDLIEDRYHKNLNMFRMLQYVPNIHLMGGLYLNIPPPASNVPLFRRSGEWVFDKTLVPSVFSKCSEAEKAFHMAQSFNSFRDTNNNNNVPQTLVYGTGFNTTIFYDYDNQVSLKEDGDGLVPISSLLYPKKSWTTNIPNFVNAIDKEHSRINSCDNTIKMLSQKLHHIPQGK